MSHLHEREGAAATNFERTLEAGDAEAVQRIARDPVVLDFVQLTDGAKERDLEAALLVDIERFMLALGEGFYFAGRQKSLEIGGEEFILDLLFYHHPTRRFVVIDLKIGRFQAEFAGKMNLYVNAVNDLVQNMKAWQARPPQIRTEVPDVDDSGPPSPPDLLPLTPADRMLPRLTGGDASDGDTADRFATRPSEETSLQGSIQGSVLSKTDPVEPDPIPATMGNPTVPPWATS